MATTTLKKITPADIRAIGTYSRSDIGTSPNFDDPGINGLFEVLAINERPKATGTRPPFGSLEYGPMLSMKSPENIAMMQIAIASNGNLYYRGKQAGAVTMANTPWRAVLNKSGDTMTGDLTVQHSGEVNIHAVSTNTNVDVALESATTGNHGIWSYGYWNGSNYVSDGKWIIHRDANGKVILGDGSLGTVVQVDTGTKNVTFNSDTAEVCHISLAAGTWVISANLQIQGATVGTRQGATITTTNSKGSFNYDAYTLISINNTSNHYFNVSNIVQPSSTTTYYLMGEADGTRNTIGKMKAVRIK